MLALPLYDMDPKTPAARESDRHESPVQQLAVHCCCSHKNLARPGVMQNKWLADHMHAQARA